MLQSFFVETQHYAALFSLPYQIRSPRIPAPLAIRVVRASAPAPCRSAFTLIELLVVIAIAGLLLALIAPAVQGVRSAARAVECRNHLRQLSLGCLNYEGAYSVLPSYGSTKAGPFVAAYPYYHGQIQLDVPDDANAKIAYFQTIDRPAVLVCPQSTTQRELTNYAANLGFAFQVYGFNGAFRPLESRRPWLPPTGQHAGPIRMADLVDGLSATAMLSEYLSPLAPRNCHEALLAVSPRLDAPAEFAAFQDACRRACPSVEPMHARANAWWDSPGYNHVLTPNSLSCTNGEFYLAGALTATSHHPGGVHAAMMDGGVRFFSENVDPILWAALGTRNGNEVISSTD